MIDLRKIFKNIFNDKNVSKYMFKSFAQEHIQRLIANNKNGQFDELIQLTQEAYDSFFGSITNLDLADSNQQGASIGVRKIMEQIKAAIGQKEGIIKGEWGKKSPTYEEFFPHKKGAFWDASKTDIEQLMSNFIAAAERHVNVLGADFVNSFKVLSSEYLIARTKQLDYVGKVAGLRTQLAESRRVLEIQLYKNLHQIALLYPDDADRGMDFFNQTHLHYRKKHKKDKDNTEEEKK